jgi:hypothetical protein
LNDKHFAVVQSEHHFLLQAFQLFNFFFDTGWSRSVHHTLDAQKMSSRQQQGENFKVVTQMLSSLGHSVVCQLNSPSNCPSLSGQANITDQGKGKAEDKAPLEGMWAERRARGAFAFHCH